MTANAKIVSDAQPEKVTIDALDGWRLCLHVVKAEEPERTAPVLVVFPALAATAGIYLRMARSLAKKGYRLVVVDARGIGDSGPFPSAMVDYGIAEQLECDWPAVVGWVKGQYPAAQIVLLGHSLGGQLSAIYAGQHAGTIDALILLNVSFVWYRNWPFPLRWVMWAIFWCCSLIAGLFGYFPGNRLGFGHRISRSVIQEWARWGLAGKYTTKSRGNLETCLEQVTCPVLSVSFSDDWFYGPSSAVNDFARRLTHSQLTRWHLAPSELDVDELGHFRYLKHSYQLWERIHKWLHVQLPKAAAYEEINGVAEASA